MILKHFQWFHSHGPGLNRRTAYSAVIPTITQQMMLLYSKNDEDGSFSQTAARDEVHRGLRDSDSGLWRLPILGFRILIAIKERTQRWDKAKNWEEVNFRVKAPSMGTGLSNATQEQTLGDRHGRELQEWRGFLEQGLLHAFHLICGLWMCQGIRYVTGAGNSVRPTVQTYCAEFKDRQQLFPLVLLPQMILDGPGWSWLLLAEQSCDVAL